MILIHAEYNNNGNFTNIIYQSIVYLCSLNINHMPLYFVVDEIQEKYMTILFEFYLAVALVKSQVAHLFLHDFSLFFAEICNLSRLKQEAFAAINLKLIDDHVYFDVDANNLLNIPEFCLAQTKKLGAKQLSLRILNGNDGLDSPSQIPLFSRFVVFGGTFDHLHDGHKLLLSIACLFAKKFIAVGITAESMLKSKQYRNLIESFKERSDKTVRFLQMFRTNIHVDVVELKDPVGPAGKSKEADLLIISEETVNGALKG